MRLSDILKDKRFNLSDLKSDTWQLVKELTQIGVLIEGCRFWYDEVTDTFTVENRLDIEYFPEEEIEHKEKNGTWIERRISVNRRQISTEEDLIAFLEII